METDGEMDLPKVERHVFKGMMLLSDTSGFHFVAFPGCFYGPRMLSSIDPIDFSALHATYEQIMAQYGTYINLGLSGQWPNIANIQHVTVFFFGLIVWTVVPRLFKCSTLPD